MPRNKRKIGSGPFQVPFPREWNCPSREKLLSTLHDTLSTQQNAAITGRPGVGKTHLAIEYCYRFKERHPGGSVFWLDEDRSISTDPASTNSERFMAFANHIELEATVLPRESQSKRGTFYNFLIVLDGLECFELWGPRWNLNSLLKSYLERHFRVLITTCNKEMAIKLTDSRTLHVDDLLIEEAVSLLRHNLAPQRASNNEYMATVMKLGCLPLDIIRVARYCNRGGLSITNYLDMLDRGRGIPRFTSAIENESAMEDREGHTIEMAPKTKDRVVPKKMSIIDRIVRLVKAGVGDLGLATVASNSTPSWSPGVNTGLAVGTFVGAVSGGVVYNCYSWRINEKRQCEEIERKRRADDAACILAGKSTQFGYSGPYAPLRCHHAWWRHSRNNGMIQGPEFRGEARKDDPENHGSVDGPSDGAVLDADEAGETGIQERSEARSTNMAADNDSTEYQEPHNQISSRRPHDGVEFGSSEIQGPDITPSTNGGLNKNQTVVEDLESENITQANEQSPSSEEISNQTANEPLHPTSLRPLPSPSIDSDSTYSQLEHTLLNAASYHLTPLSSPFRPILPPFPETAEARKTWYQASVLILDAAILEADLSAAVWQKLGYGPPDPQHGRVLQPLPPDAEGRDDWIGLYSPILQAAEKGLDWWDLERYHGITGNYDQTATNR